MTDALKRDDFVSVKAEGFLQFKFQIVDLDSMPRVLDFRELRIFDIDHGKATIISQIKRYMLLISVVEVEL